MSFQIQSVLVEHARIPPVTVCFDTFSGAFLFCKRTPVGGSVCLCWIAVVCFVCLASKFFVCTVLAVHVLHCLLACRALPCLASPCLLMHDCVASLLLVVLAATL